MATTYEALATVSVGSGGSATISFTSISATYTDLYLVVSARTTGSADPTIRCRFNSDSGANYTYKVVYGDGSTAGSYDQTGPGSGNTFANMGYAPNTGYTASTFGISSIYIPNYAGSTAKSWSVNQVNENNATSTSMHLIAGLWNSTSAITSITLSQGTNNYAEFSTATLYGIKNS